LTRLFVEYGASRFTHEVGINITQIGDVGNDFILALNYYRKGKENEYSLEHEDSMEV
jgi:hypothetical protein